MAGQVCHTLRQPTYREGSYGRQINRILEDAAPPLRFVAVHSVPVQNTGGTQYEVFAIFDVLELDQHNEPVLSGKELDLVDAMVKNLRRENERLAQQNADLVALNKRIRQMADEATNVIDSRLRPPGAEGAVQYLIQQYKKCVENA